MGFEMQCLDISASGNNFLSLELMIEQIWFGGDRHGLRPTEVYDLLLVCDDEGPVDTIHVLLPHFCRSQDHHGNWRDHISLLIPGDEETGWGWMYSEVKASGGVLACAIADLAEKANAATKRLEGRTMPRAEIRWHPDLEEPSRLAVMQSIRKSLYVIRFPEPLRGRAREACWLRLVVQPQELDIDSQLIRDYGPSGFFKSRLSLYAYALCPVIVRERFAAKLEEYERSHVGRCASLTTDSRWWASRG